MATIKGGEALDKALKDIARKLRKPGMLRVGFMADATYPNGTLIAMVAAIQNYGAPRRKIPARPFFSNMVRDKSPGWPSAIRKNLKTNNYDTELALKAMGLGIESQLRDAIINTNSPPLSPITVMLRGMRANDSSLKVTGRTVGIAAARVRAGKTNYGASTKPLVDSGDMLNAVTSNVKAK